MKKTTTQTQNNQRGAALLLALGFMVVFSVLGAAYVLHIQLEDRATALRLMEIRAKHTAEGGIQCALGELLKSPDTLLEKKEFSHSFPVYGIQRVAPSGNLTAIDTTAKLDNARAEAKVTITPVDPMKYPSVSSEGKLFRLTSDATASRVTGGHAYDRASAHVEAVLLLKADGPEFVYWNATPGYGPDGP
jgi:Tfp pilus assembly protein PilX